MNAVLGITLCAAAIATRSALAGPENVERDAGRLFRIDLSGRLVYLQDGKGNRQPDFSWVGCHSGDRVIPEVPVRITLSPAVEGDDTARIQDAIDKLGALPADASGFCGALLLMRGVYRVEGVLRIGHSVVVMGGEGSGVDGTVIVATSYDSPRYQRTLITVGNGKRIQLDEASRRLIIDDYVPVGALYWAWNGKREKLAALLGIEVRRFC